MHGELDLHVRISPDETEPGTMRAEIKELGVSTVLREGEDPFPILLDLVRGTLRALDQLGRLEETLQRLIGRSVGSTPPPELVAKFNLESRHAL